MPRREIAREAQSYWRSEPAKEIAIAISATLTASRHARAFFRVPAEWSIKILSLIMAHGGERYQPNSSARELDAFLTRRPLFILCSTVVGNGCGARRVEYCCGISTASRPHSSDRDYKGVPVDRQLREFCEKAWNGIRIVLARSPPGTGTACSDLENVWREMRRSLENPIRETRYRDSTPSSAKMAHR